MNIHFIDTSVFTNILDVPFMNDERESVMSEFRQILKAKDTDKMILPFATIIETGNHIAHNGSGSQRRRVAERFSEIIEKTIWGEAPWAYYGQQLTMEDLHAICIQFPEAAMRGEGFGDLSIIQAYHRYKEAVPAINEIRIWTLDRHMRDIYHEKLHTIKTRNSPNAY